MAWEHDREMTLSDGRVVLVCYTVESCGSEPSGLGGLPEDYDPGEGPELYVTSAIADDGTEEGSPVELSDAERERLETIIAESPDWWMPDPYDGWEDY